MADKYEPSKRSGKDADKYDTGKASTGKAGQKHADKYENTREGTCKGSLAQAEMDLSEGDSEEKPSGTCKNADNHHDDREGARSSDVYGKEGTCKGCSADTFGNKVNNADSSNKYDRRGKANRNGRSSDSMNPNKRSGKGADSYENSGKVSSSDTRKHVDKYENTRESDCKSSSLAELDDCSAD